MVYVCVCVCVCVCVQSVCPLCGEPMEEVHSCGQTACLYSDHHVRYNSSGTGTSVIGCLAYLIRHLKGKVFILLQNSNVATFRRFPG